MGVHESEPKYRVYLIDTAGDRVGGPMTLPISWEAAQAFCRGWISNMDSFEVRSEPMPFPVLEDKMIEAKRAEVAMREWNRGEACPGSILDAVNNHRSRQAVDRREKLGRSHLIGPGLNMQAPPTYPPLVDELNKQLSQASQQ